MNNNIIKSLRRTLLNTVAAAVVSIGFTACADEMFETQNASTSTNGNIYKFNIPASMGKGDSRAITYNETTKEYDATFETTDLIEVYNVTKNAYSRKKSKYGGWDEVYLQPDANGKTANLVGELAFAVRDQETWSYSEITPEVGDVLILLYNNNYQVSFGYDYCNEGDNPDFAIANATIVSINDGLVKTSAASFENPQSLYKINFTGIGSGVKIKKVIISSEQKKLVDTYAPADVERQNLFGDVTYTYEGEGVVQHEQIFMLRFADNPEKENSSGDVITFKVIGSDGHYYVGTKSVSSNLINGKYYHADVAMTDAGLAMTLTNTTTGETVELNRWNKISTTDAAYVATNTGYDTSFEWYGGDKKLTFKNLSIYNSNSVIEVYSNEDSEDSKIHYLVLDGENTLGCIQDVSALNLNRNNTLIISAPSKGKLNITGNGYISLEENTKLIIEGGEVKVDQYIRRHSSSRVFLSGDAKLSIKTDYVDDFIKAANGYVLQTAKEDDYTVYTVKAADPYEEPKALSSATTADLGKIIGSDNNVHVLNWDLPEGVRPVAMIADISSTGHGLAIAMEGVKVVEEGGWSHYDFSWDNSDERNKGKTATELFDEWKTNNNVNFGTWRLATFAEWQKMAINCRINGDASAASESMVVNGLATKLKEVSILKNNSLNCWAGEGSEQGKIVSIYLGLINEHYMLSADYDTNPTFARSILPVLEFGQE